MDLLTLLSYEEDILALVTGYLDIRSLLALEISSSHFRQLLQDSKVWRVAFDKVAKATHPGYDWRRRLTGRRDKNAVLLPLELRKNASTSLKTEVTESERNVALNFQISVPVSP